MADSERSPRIFREALVHNSPSIIDFDQLEPDRDDHIDLYAPTDSLRADALGSIIFELQASIGGTEMPMSLDSFQFEDDDNPFTGTVDLDTMQHLGVRRPTTTLESDDSDELDEHTYQDEGLRRQLRITLRRVLNYNKTDSVLKRQFASEHGVVSPSSDARRLSTASDFKTMHQEVANRLSLEVFDSNVAMSSGARSNSVPGFAKRKSHGRLSILPDSIKADEIGCNLLRHRRIRTATSTFANEIVDDHSILNGIEKSFTKIDLLDIDEVIEEEATQRRKLFRKRRRQTREITEKHVPERQLESTPTKLTHRSFVPDDSEDSLPSHSYQLPVYSPIQSNRVDITSLLPGDLIFVFDCVTTHSAEMHDRPASTVKHVMIVTHQSAVSIEVAHVTRSCSERSCLKAWEDPESEQELMSRQSIFRMMADIPEAINHMAAGYLGVAFRPSNPIVKMPNGSTQDVSLVAGQVANAMIKTGRVIPSNSVIKSTCLAEASKDSFLLKNKYSFYRRPIREIWDKADGFLNLFPEDFVVLCYHRAIVKCCKSFDKELIKLLDVDWRACNIHDLYNYLGASPDWWSPGEVLFEFF